MIVFIDKGESRGGGQVVLERLLSFTSAQCPSVLIMPAAGRRSIAVPDDVASYDDIDSYLKTGPQGPQLILCNANASLPLAWDLARRLKRQYLAVRNVVILHNYAGSFAKRVATKLFLKQVDDAILVEPGLASLYPSAYIPAWLSVAPQTRPEDYVAPIQRTGMVKCFARPDKEKGLHLLPKIYGALTAEGYRCEVAVGIPQAKDLKYQRKLLAELEPWLVDGYRTAAWLDPGDVVVLPSLTEAACLTAQEAMSNGTFCVASRTGLMSYLSPINSGIRTFAVGDIDHATRTLREVLTMPEDKFSAECLKGVRTISEREDIWYQEVVDYLLEAERSLG